jgi:CheY-like chemotaxis protein
MTRLLIIDDDDLTLQLYDLLLEGVPDISFEKAENGTDALEMLRSFKQHNEESDKWPQLIFIDLHMPDMSGYEFVDYYQTQFGDKAQNSRLYFLTSSISQRDLNKSKDYEIVSGILPKPLTEDKLNELIATTN